MSVREFSDWAAQQPVVLLIVFTALPVLAYGLGKAHGRGRGEMTPWKFVYTVLIYLTVVPGTFAGLIVAYTLFFTRGNLLEANLLVTALPIVSMILTLFAMRGNVEFDAVPGFDRLWGLVVMSGMSFFMALVISKTGIRLLFFGTIGTFIMLGIACFALLSWGAHVAFRKKDEDIPEMPRILDD